MKTIRVFSLSFCLLAAIPSALAATVQGTVKDPSGAPISGAQVAAVGRVGVIAERLTDKTGRFKLDTGDATDLIVNAGGFATKSVSVAAASDITLEIAAQTDSVRVTGSAIDTPASQQGTSISVISTEEIRGRNEAQAVDLLRYLPGLVIQQGGHSPNDSEEH